MTGCYDVRPAAVLASGATVISAMLLSDGFPGPHAEGSHQRVPWPAPGWPPDPAAATHPGPVAGLGLGHVWSGIRVDLVDHRPAWSQPGRFRCRPGCSSRCHRVSHAHLAV